MQTNEGKSLREQVREFHEKINKMLPRYLKSFSNTIEHDLMLRQLGFQLPTQTSYKEKKK